MKTLMIVAITLILTGCAADPPPPKLAPADTTGITFQPEWLFDMAHAPVVRQPKTWQEMMMPPERK